MAQIPIIGKKQNFTATVTTGHAVTGTLAIAAIKKGDRVQFGSIEVLVAAVGFADSLVVQYSVGPVVLHTIADMSAVAAGDLINMVGAGMLTAGGLFATADGTIQVVYTRSGGAGTGSTVATKVAVRMGITKHEHIA